jgi:hypothetical protein
LWLKGLNGIGDQECFGILRCAQDDGKSDWSLIQDAARTGGALLLVGYVLLRVKHQLAVLRGEVFEFGICPGDPGELFCSGPAFHLFFSREGGTYVGVALVQEEAVASVLLAKLDLMLFLCSKRRRSNLLVTPVYRVPVMLPRM